MRATADAEIESAAGAYDSRLHQVFNTAADGMCLIDRQFHIIKANNTFAAMFRLPHKEMARAHCFDVMTGCACNTGQCCLKRILDGEERIEFETWKRRPDGSRFPCIVAASPLFGPDGAIMGIVEDIRDITQLKETETKLKESYEKLHRTLEGTIHAMSFAIESRDPYTAGHQRRVAGLAVAIAREMGIDEHRVEGIRIAALIHDIGKISIPAEILAKPGRLSKKEFALMMEHPQVGFEILMNIDFGHPVAEAVRQHHERMDGSGYPLGLAGDDILLEARIIAVSDVVESIATHRPYRPALGIKKALREISSKQGRLYDPAVARACVRLFQLRKFKLG